MLLEPGPRDSGLDKRRILDTRAEDWRHWGKRGESKGRGKFQG